MKDQIILNPADFTNPRGNNSLTSLALYYQRLLYKEEVYPTRLTAPLDTWYDKMYYGRVDQRQNSITPKQSKLKMVEGSKDVYALGCVADAFKAFANHMREATVIGVCVGGGNSAITNPVAKKGYEPILATYGDFLSAVATTYQNTLPPTTDKITDFLSYSNGFLVFLRDLASKVPVTFTNYLLTPSYNAFNSGLSIAIETSLDPGTDAPKYDDFIGDPNFDVYVKVAKKYGFTVNKNMPWILTADLFTQSSLVYISQYNDDAGTSVNKDTFFSTFFDLICYDDIYRLRILLKNSYQSFISREPFYEKYQTLKRCGRSVLKTYNRGPAPLSLQAAEELLTDKYMLDLYLDLRSIEAGRPLQVSRKLRTELANIYQLRPNPSLTPLENAIQYINMIYRDYIYDTTYPSLYETIKVLDNNAMVGTIATAASIATELY